MDIGERIKARRKQLGISVDAIAEKLGVDRSTIYRYESEYIEKFPVNIVPALSEVLMVSPAYLMGWENEAYTVKTKKIPLLGSIAAGEPIFANEDTRTYIEVDGSISVDFCLRVKGDSMVDARINDGDIVFIRQQPEVETGEIAAVMIDDEVTLKRIYKNDGGVILKPENAKYQPQFYSQKDSKNVRVLGKAVLLQSKV